jgi:hypothetical protein
MNGSIWATSLLCVVLAACGGKENIGTASPEEMGGAGGAGGAGGGAGEGGTAGSGGGGVTIDSGPPPLSSWWQTYLQINGIARGNDLYVAVGSEMADAEDTTPDGVIYTSPDGFTWTPSAVTLPAAAQDVAFGNGAFLAIVPQESSMLAYRSEDGNTWTRAVVQGAMYAGQSLAFGNGTFVAVLNGHVVRSTDGKNWQSSPHELLEGIEFGAGRFVVWHGAQFESSKNGVDWVASSPIRDDVQFNNVRLFGSDAGFRGSVGYYCCFGEVPPTFATIESDDGSVWKLDEQGGTTVPVVQEPHVCITFERHGYASSFSAGSSCSQAGPIVTDHGFVALLVHRDGPAYLLAGAAGIYSSKDGLHFEPTLIHSKQVFF